MALILKEEVANASADDLADVMMRSMTDKKTDQLQNMSRMEAAERAVLKHYNKEIDNVSDADFIKLVEQMTIGKFTFTS